MRWTEKTGWILGQVCALGVSTIIYFETRLAGLSLVTFFLLALLVDIRDRLEHR